MAAHHDADVNAGKRGIVEIYARKRLGDKTRGGGKARRMIVADQIVVDGLGNMNAAQRIIGFMRLLGDDAHRIGGIVAADIKEGADFMRLQNLEDLVAIFQIRLVAGGAQRRGRGFADQQKTLGGLINNEQHDNSRIGGSIGDKLQLVAKNVFNWWVQMYYVYYDEPHFAAIMGQMQSVEYITLKAQALDRQIIVSVAPNSMKPHDEITEMNQAMSLWEAKAIDIKTLLTRLNFPDPQETAAQAWLYQVDPMTYGKLNFPELSQQVEAMMQQQQQAQAQQQQAQVEQQGAQAQQDMAIKEATNQQGITHKEEAHQQKLRHDEESFKNKQKLTPKEK